MIDSIIMILVAPIIAVVELFALSVVISLGYERRLKIASNIPASCSIDPREHPGFAYDMDGNGWIGNILVIKSGELYPHLSF